MRQDNGRDEHQDGAERDGKHNQDYGATALTRGATAIEVALLAE
jgi:hypothetical protein